MLLAVLIQKCDFIMFALFLEFRLKYRFPLCVFDRVAPKVLIFLVSQNIFIKVIDLPHFCFKAGVHQKMLICLVY